MTHDSAAATGTPSSRDKKTKIQVIARAASVLRALEHEPAGLSLGAIAQRLKLPRSTVQRIVGALEAENLLIAASPTGRVKLGPALLRLSASVDSSVSTLAKPAMLEIARDLEQSVELSVMSRDHAVCIDQAGPQPTTVLSAIGEKYPLHYTALGKAMLALLTDAEIEQKIGHYYPARTEFTHTSLSALLIDVHEARHTGVAYDLQEHILGVCGVGVGLHDAVGNRLALSMSIPITRFEQLKAVATERLLELRGRLMAPLGGQ